MKKLLLLCFVATSSQITIAQVQKGQWLAGGSAGFNSYDYGSSKTNTFHLSPNVGYFIITKLATGLRLELSQTKYKSQFVDEKYKYTLVTPFARYYLLPGNQKINIFTDASFGFGNSKVESQTDKVQSFSVAAGPAIFITPNTALEFTVGYNSTKRESQSESVNSLKVGVGFQIHLNKLKK